MLTVTTAIAALIGAALGIVWLMLSEAVAQKDDDDRAADADRAEDDAAIDSVRSALEQSRREGML